MTIDRRTADRRQIAMRIRVETALIQILALTGGVGVGVILMSSVIFTEADFWRHVETFLGAR